MGQAFFHHIIHHSYSPLIKFLPQSLADLSYDGNAGVEPGAPTAGHADPAQLRTSSYDITASDSNKQLNEKAPPLPIHSIIERPEAPPFTKELHASAPLSMRPMNAESPTKFGQPAAVEEQRIIWLPKDPDNLVHDLEEELDLHKVRYSSSGATMDKKGKVEVDVTSALPEDVQRAPISRPRDREGIKEGVLSLWELAHDKCCREV